MSNHLKLNKFYLPDRSARISTFTLISLGNKNSHLASINKILLLLSFIFVSGLTAGYSQTPYQPNYFAPQQPNYGNYMANSTAFKQEIARVEINVVREGREPLPITQVPRLEKDDVLKVRLLEEQVNGMKPDQSNWNWTFLVAYINPARNNEREKSVSEEIQFRKTGWYKEYSFVVPYDSQPIFFLYSKPNYRTKILNLINKKQEDIRKIGEKTLELSGAYAKIGSFLNELQYVVNRGAYGYGGYGGYGNTYGSGYGSSYGGYGSYYGGGYGTDTGFNVNMFMEQAVERLARSFNIQLPQCWQNGSFGYGSYSGYGSYGNQNNFYGVSQDFVGRAQCVAKSVRLEDFDISISQMLQQGGIMAAAQLAQKYPQIAFWINVAAAALDFILKLTKKSPLKIVPTVISSSDNQSQNFGYQNAFPAAANIASAAASRTNQVKISLFAEAPPNDSGFVTAYPLVIHKWQANPDPEVISLPTPVLTNQCLHAGQNLLKSTDLMSDWMADNFTKDFQLEITSPNGFRKEFPLKKNVGLGGWELNITKEELNDFPKINMALESVVTGKRGFNEIRSPKFNLPLPLTGVWTVKPETQKAFAVGGKRIITLRNELGNCKCLQAVVYKPSFGGQFVFDAGGKINGLRFSEDGKEVSFEIDTTNFQPGQGQLELKQYGGEMTALSVALYALPPEITDLKISNGDSRGAIAGERIDQVQAVRINGKRAVIENRDAVIPDNNQNNNNQIQAGNPSPPVEFNFVFENPDERLTSNVVSIELELEGGRIYQYPKTFKAALSRPAIIAGKALEVEAVALTGTDSAAQTDRNKAVSAGKKAKLPTAWNALPIFSIETSEIAINVQNALTDYDFKAENIQIETRIENSEINSIEQPKTEFEVLDWKNMRLSFSLTEPLQKLLGGRRLQFRIRDKVRGNSDWYTISKTFVRFPENLSVKCTAQFAENCEMTGKGVEYISQVSIDGGQNWFPQQPATLTVQPAPDGKKVVMIPFFSNKKSLQIRLRDFPQSEGLMLADYNFLNTVKRRN